jgi:serine/threonine protein kinase
MGACHLAALADWDSEEEGQCYELDAVALHSQPAADLLRRGLARDPAQRLTLQQLLEHPFVAARVAKFSKLAARQLRTTKQQQQHIADMFAGPLAAALEAEQLPMPATPTPADHRAAFSSSSSSSSVYGSPADAAVASTAVEAQQQPQLDDGCSTAWQPDVQQQQQQQQQFDMIVKQQQQQEFDQDVQPVGCFAGLLSAFTSRASKPAATADNSSVGSTQSTAAAAMRSSSKAAACIKQLWSKCKVALHGGSPRHTA